MPFLKLNSLRTLFATINTRLISSSLLVLAALVFCQSSSVQNIQPRPVARLISEPAGNVFYTRPRRVIADGSSQIAEAGSTAAPSIDEATAIERRAFDKTNEARVQNGLTPLAWDPELCLMARQHSENMAQHGFFSHETPEGLRPKDRARAFRILHFRVLGENIAYNKGYDDPGAFAVERWMISPGHRANILYIGFQASATGSYVSTDGSVYLTQVFITR